MQTPDLCTALINLIERDYGEGLHITEAGDIDPKWVYATMAMASIGHTVQPRMVSLAAASMASMTEEDRTEFMGKYLLPPLVTNAYMAGNTSWPSKLSTTNNYTQVPIPTPTPASDPSDSIAP